MPRSSRASSSRRSVAADPASRFDAAYYRRFYFNTRTAVTHRAEMTARARLIAAYVDYLGVPVRSILDAGCGVGLLRKPLLRLLPRAEYLGLEYSPYLCERYGWHCGSLAKFRPRHPFDLVICYDVGQYLDELTARQALTNLARLCRGVLYFTALTTTDWQHNCDRSRTDGNVHLRSRAWYDRRLQKHFRRAGVGFWIRRSAPITAWDMEAD